MITNTFDINTFVDVTISKKKTHDTLLTDYLMLEVITFVHEISSLFVRIQQCINKKIVSLMCD